MTSMFCVQYAYLVYLFTLHGILMKQNYVNHDNTPSFDVKVSLFDDLY
jgi:hypothetical protein